MQDLPVAIMETEWDRGRRSFLFPPLPATLTRSEQIGVCTQWTEKELTSRGMIVDAQLYRTKMPGRLAPTFICTIRELEGEGFGERVPEWGTAEFFEHLKQSFTQAVNDALTTKGRPSCYAVF